MLLQELSTGKDRLSQALWTAEHSPTKDIDVSQCALTELPHEVMVIGQLTRKETLLAHNNYLLTLPASIGRWSSVCRVHYFLYCIRHNLYLYFFHLPAASIGSAQQFYQQTADRAQQFVHVTGKILVPVVRLSAPALPSPLRAAFNHPLHRLYSVQVLNLAHNQLASLPMCICSL